MASIGSEKSSMQEAVGTAPETQQKGVWLSKATNIRELTVSISQLGDCATADR